MGKDNDGRDGRDTPLIEGKEGRDGSFGVLTPNEGAPGTGTDSDGVGGALGAPGTPETSGFSGIRGSEGRLSPNEGAPGIGIEGVGIGGDASGNLQLMKTP